MSDRIKALRERRGNLLSTMRGLVELVERESRDMSKEERARHGQLYTEQQGVKEEIDALERQREVDSAAELRADDQMHGVLRPGALSEAEIRSAREALSLFATTGQIDRRGALSVGGDGGYIVQAAMAPEILRRAVNTSAVRRRANIVILKSGTAYEQPIVKDLASAGWVGEEGARPEGTPPGLGKVVIPLNEASANIPVAQSTLDLSSYDVASMIEATIGDKIGELEASAFTVGDTILKPQGFLTVTLSSAIDGVRAWGALQSVVTGAAAALSADGLVELMSSLRGVYRPNACWMMNRASLAKVRQLKDAENRYILMEGVGPGEAPHLFGYPVELDDSMPDVGAGTYPVAFGDFQRGYTIVEWSTLRLVRDPYSSKPNVLFYAYKRVGGGVVDFDAIKVQKVAES